MTQTYPRIYRFKGWVLGGWLILELAMIAAGVAAVIFAGEMFKNAVPVGWAFGGLFIALGGVALLSTMRGKLVLYGDRCEYTGILATRIMRTSEVKETRNVKQQYGHLVATVVLKSGRKITISDFGHLDDPLTDWLNGFPNAEAEAEVKRSDRLMANPAFGSNPTEREHHINADVQLLNGLRWPCYALFLWGMVWPYPYTTCLSILVMMPPIGLVATFASRGRWTMLDENAGKLSIGTGLFMSPAMVLALRAFLDDHTVDWTAPAAWSAGAAVVLVGLNGLIERRLSPAGMAGLVCLWGLYAWGGLLYADTTFDSSTATSLRARVLDMTEGEHDHTLRLSAWGTRPAGNEVAVGGRFYRKLHVGDTICVHVYPGRLNWPWYAVGRCPQGK